MLLEFIADGSHEAMNAHNDMTQLTADLFWSMQGFAKYIEGKRILALLYQCLNWV